MYALDAQTGKELWSSGDQIASWNHFSGLTVANGRVYIGTFDGMLYCFGAASLPAPAPTTIAQRDGSDEARADMMLALSLASRVASCCRRILHAQGRGGGSGPPAASTRSGPARSAPIRASRSRRWSEARRVRALQVSVEVEARARSEGRRRADRADPARSLIGFRGFKSIAFVATASETVHAVDIDFGTPLWKYHINYSASPPPVIGEPPDCPGGLTAALSRPTAIAPPALAVAAAVAAGRPSQVAVSASPGEVRRRSRRRGSGPRRQPAAAPPAAARRAARRGRAGIRRRQPAGSAGRDCRAAPGRRGRRRRWIVRPAATRRTSSAATATCTRSTCQNGWDNMTPAPFLPANTRATGLIVATRRRPAPSPMPRRRMDAAASPTPCGRWICRARREPVAAFKVRRRHHRRHGRLRARPRRHRLHRDGRGRRRSSNSMFALEPKTLKLKGVGRRSPKADFSSSPLVFQWKDKDAVVVAGGGKLFLFDAASLESGPIASAPFVTAAYRNRCARELDGCGRAPAGSRCPPRAGSRPSRLSSRAASAAFAARLDFARHRVAAAAAGHQRRAVRGVERHPRRARGALRPRRRDRQGILEQRQGNHLSSAPAACRRTG